MYTYRASCAHSNDHNHEALIHTQYMIHIHPQYMIHIHPQYIIHIHPQYMIHIHTQYMIQIHTQYMIHIHSDMLQLSQVLCRYLRSSLPSNFPSIRQFFILYIHVHTQYMILIQETSYTEWCSIYKSFAAHHTNIPPCFICADLLCAHYIHVHTQCITWCNTD